MEGLGITGLNSDTSSRDKDQVRYFYSFPLLERVLIGNVCDGVLNGYDGTVWYAACDARVDGSTECCSRMFGVTTQLLKAACCRYNEQCLLVYDVPVGGRGRGEAHAVQRMCRGMGGTKAGPARTQS